MSQTFKTTTSTTSRSKAIRRVQVTKTTQRTLPDGKVVTETTTEYKELTDDSGFSDFGGGATSGFTSSSASGFPSLSSGSTFQVKKEDTSSSSSDEDDEKKEKKFIEDAIKATNEYRSKHGVSLLKHDKKLSKYAQEWADKLAKEDKFEHRNDQRYGENLYCSWSSKAKAKCPGKKPVDSWYEEVKSHTFGVEPTSMASGHFTQLVWKGSKTMGIGKARSKSGKTIVVANFEPPGNFIGQYKENVLPPKN